jgi:cob(I)alamin adenosyltransferase
VAIYNSTISRIDMKGYIHVYTGDGKGKTTAALGLALRAFGAGKKVFIAQFIKGMPYSEIEAINNFLPGISIKQYGLDCFIKNKPTEKDVEAARSGLSEVSKIIASGDFNLVVLDEACIAVYYHLFTSSELLSIIKSKPESLEIVITGRYATEELIESADLVTEMKEVKHYYNQGVQARKGIEF